MKLFKLRSTLNKRGYHCGPLKEDDKISFFNPTKTSKISLSKSSEILVLELSDKKVEFPISNANLISAILTYLEKPDPISEPIPPDEMQGFINYSRDLKAEDAEELRD